MKVVLIHGKNTDPTKKWYPWFAAEVPKFGVEFIAPILPNSEDPIMAEWLAEIDKTQPDSETILVGHSRGGVAVLHWLENQAPEVKVKKVILIATNSGKLTERAIPEESNSGFFTETGYDFAKIKTHCDQFVVLHSTDDPTVPFAQGEYNAQKLAAKFYKFSNRLHLGSAVPSIPELLAEVKLSKELI